MIYLHTILVLEDDIELNNTICYSLEKNGYRVMGAKTCEEAKNYTNSYTFHMAILDINLPDGNGFQFCKWIKARSNTLILFLSAKDLETDILHGYELGADDYVTKPFNPLESKSEKDFEDFDTGGMGIMLVKEVCSNVSYSNPDGKNVLTLEFTDRVNDGNI